VVCHRPDVKASTLTLYPTVVEVSPGLSRTINTLEVGGPGQDRGIFTRVEDILLKL
jgi:hypothetical protein